MLAMLREGDLDAVIVGSDVPADPAFRTVFREPNVAGTTFFQKHGFVPINHLLTVRSELVQRYPFAVRALVQMFRDAGACRTPHTIAHPNSRDEVDDALQLASRYAFEQELIPQSLSLSQIWDGTPAELT